MNDILSNIKQLRDKAGLSQENMANLLNMEQASYGLIENGKRKLKYETLKQIALCFKLNVIDVITFPEKWSVINENKAHEPVEAIIQIKLQSDKKDQVLKLIFGENNLEILNK
jgi:transcriptional regulator with XRE-family HTH domain